MSNLSEQQISLLQQQLLQRASELKQKIQDELRKSADERYIQLADSVHDTRDEAVVELVINVAPTLTNLQIHELRHISNALTRIASQSYGICVDCEGKIDYRRLLAYPTAKRCVDCQSAYEQDFGTPQQSLM